MSHRIDRKRTGRAIPALAAAALLTTAAAIAPACKGVVVTTIEPVPPPTIGEVGDPCRPQEERHPDFAGYKVNELQLEDRVSTCNSGVCLINHIQGRTDCPLGQAAPTPCTGPGDTSCGDGSSCTASAWTGPFCTVTSVDGGPPVQDPVGCASGACNSPHHTCQCTSDAQCPAGARCDPATKECTQYVCHHEGDCQSPGAPDAANAGKSCCTGDHGPPVSAEVCGQCEEGSGRTAAEATYCTCRCGPADGAPSNGAEFCSCPTGFECAPLTPYIGIGDDNLSGKFCVKPGSAFTDAGQCGTVNGHFNATCAGTPAN
jgi:Cys-rich repeat protein